MNKEEKKLLTVAYCTIPEISDLIDSFDGGIESEDLFTEDNLIGKLVEYSKQFITVKIRRIEGERGFKVDDEPRYIPTNLPPGDKYGWSSYIQVHDLKTWVNFAWNEYSREMMEAWLLLPSMIREKFLVQKSDVLKKYRSFIRTYEAKRKIYESKPTRKLRRELYLLKYPIVNDLNNFDFTNSRKYTAIYWPFFKKALMETDFPIPCSLTFYPDYMLDIMKENEDGGVMNTFEILQALVRYRNSIDTFVVFAYIYDEKGRYYKDEEGYALEPDYIHDFQDLLDRYVPNKDS